MVFLECSGHANSFYPATTAPIPIFRTGDFTVSIEDIWQSPHSDATYPAEWTMTIPSQELSLGLTPHVANHELNVSYAYWEGAVQVIGEQLERTVSGNGYVELTGGAASMQAQP